MTSIDTPVTASGDAARAGDALRDALGERVVLPDDPDYDAARTAWNLAVDQRPVAVAFPESAEDVVAIVRTASGAGLHVAAQSTGHGAGALDTGALSRAVLVSLTRLRGVTVDPEHRTARALGGSLWTDVLDAAAPHGLTALHGSAGDVSVVGYSLSGGISFYGRSHGLAVGAVREVQIVTADGRLRRASADENPELFWAVRGGGGSFGVVVSIEIDLLPIADIYAGMLLWPADRTTEVAHAWARWTQSAPLTSTTSLRVMSFPPLPELPPFLSGRSVIVIDGAIEEQDAVASALLAELRALEPEIDTFTRIPSSQLVAVHMDPPAPAPAATDHVVLGAFPDAAVAAFAAAAQTPGLFVMEVRHVGGALAHRAETAGAIGSIDGEYIAHSIALVPAPELWDGAVQAVRGATAGFAPWRIDALAPTFVDSPDADPSLIYGSSWAELTELKAAFDPSRLFLAARTV